MVLVEYFDLVLHRGETTAKITNMDPYRYSYLELVDDVLNVLVKNDVGIGVSIEVEFELWNDKSRRPITGDQDMLNMFNLNDQTATIDIHVKFNPTYPLNTQSPEVPILESTQVPTSLVTQLTVTENLNRNNTIYDNFFTNYAHLSDIDYGVDVVVDELDMEVEKGEVVFSDSDKEWCVDCIESSENSDATDSFSDEKDAEAENENEGLSDFEEEYEIMGKSKDSESDKEKVYIDRGIQGRPFARQLDGKVHLHEGLLFSDVNEFREVLKDYVIQEGFEIIRLKNEKSRVTCICAAPNCGWHIHASPTPDGRTFKIKTYRPIHSCIRTTTNSNATSTWISKKLEGKLRADPDLSYKSMKEDLQQQFGLEAHPMQLYRARRKVNEDNKGFHAKSYSKLPLWCDVLKQTNPGSLAKMEYAFPRMYSNPQFKRLFFCIDSVKKGFVKGCRPWFGIDGCHLKGPFGGIMLSAVSIDGNKGMSPLAIAIVESESKETWKFFLYNLHQALSTEPEFAIQPSVTIMSDQQKGLDQAVVAIMPYARHRYCCNHLLNNLKLKFPDLLLRPFFWAVAKAPNLFLFNKVVEKIKEVDPEAANWLLCRPIEMWARHTIDPNSKSDHVTNNVCESFNNWVGEDRSKTILSMVESLTKRIMTKMHKRYEKACGWDHCITPRIRTILDLVIQEGRQCKATCAGDDEFEVIDRFATFLVNLRRKTCNCNSWLLSGLPCKHVCACVSYKRVDVQRYCNEYYSREVYMTTYNEIVHPMPDLDGNLAGFQIPEHREIDPPELRRARGKPKKSRKRGADEPPAGSGNARRSCTVRCDNCKQFGHNRRTCKGGPVRKKGKKQHGDESGNVNVQAITNVKSAASKSKQHNFATKSQVLSSGSASNANVNVRAFIGPPAPSRGPPLLKEDTNDWATL